jgi:hypothetical protein|tara:strand:- start:258 stop:587 length:330 start_codon:yes stop_codon:yes gene_type:complete
MKDNEQGELIFLDEFRSEKENQEEAWQTFEDMLNENGHYRRLDLPEVSDEELDDFQYEYLTGSDLATLTMPEIRWIIRHLIDRSDFEWRKEEAEKMINEILEDREKEDT